jgi:probable addiction module antidote protein
MKKSSRSARPWTPAEDDELKKLSEFGLQGQLIARKLKRTPSAVRSRQWVHRHPRKKKEPARNRFRDNPGVIANYLNQALSSRDGVLVVRAIGEAIRAQGMARFSKRAGMQRSNLYRSFRGEISPKFETVLDVLSALDLDLIVKPSSRVERGLKAKAK